MENKEGLKAESAGRACGILNSVTGLDVRLVDRSGSPVLKLESRSIPAVLACGDDWEQVIKALEKGGPGSYCYHTNCCSLEYAASGIWDSGVLNGAVFAGPFISEVPGEDFISSVIFRNGIPISERMHLKEFYGSLALAGMGYASDIAALMVNLFSHPFISPKLAAEKALEYRPLTKADLKADAEETKSVITSRYAMEKELMNAIAKGDRVGTDRLLEENELLMNLPQRADSPVRSLKNVTLVLNTLCRIAAERGGVHPVYLHNMSEKFAVMIERAPNLPYLKELTRLMVDEYCSLVRTMSGISYSHSVKKAADYIDLNIDRQLTVKEIAVHVHINPSHLSRKFKSETGMTIVDYINNRRVEESKLYLETGSASITEVALMVGYNDLNYFGRVFRKVTGMSPSEYVRSKKQDLASSV
jgi:AraC-like DNA-binding protein